MKNIFFASIVFAIFSCSTKSDGVFESMNDTGIDFENTVKNTADFNIFNYRNFYNGGGVAVGDINNDGLQDVLFTSNMGENKLYLNKGNFKFDDISTKAGITEKGKWNTGVVMVDINADGWLDIYICNAGVDKWKKKQGNTLFINNHNMTFTEKAAEYGLAETGYTTHAAFLDYDLDGDLDCYMLNNSFIPVNTLNYDNNRNLRAEDWPVKDFLKGGGDKLMKNENGKFVDVSKEAGIFGSLIGFGLGVTVGDVNNDNYPDIYISNDFFEKDYLYINQKNGTFTEELEKRIGHTSSASMGADMADLNNDGNQEIFVTDMLPRTEERLKTTTSFDNHYVFDLKQKKGFYNQYMQNTLQLNNGDGTYSEVANYANVAASDWSWGTLLFDADNDLKTDIYICNGILNDVIDQDFIDFFANEVNMKMVLSGEKEKFDNIIKQMPSKPQVNMFFHNEGNMKFKEESAKFGFTEKSFSNGAAYADLDNDGDLDLVVNNVNQKAFVFKNKTDKKNNFLKIKLNGSGKNTKAIGAKILVFVGKDILVKQLNPSKGFQSSTEYPQTFGLGNNTKVDSVKIIWPNNTASSYKNLKVNTNLTFDIKEAKPFKLQAITISENKYFEKSEASFFDQHVENDYVDFFNEKNIPMMLSTEGPKAAVGDVNKDGLQDIFICGAKNQGGQLYFQRSGGFVKSNISVFQKTSYIEDTAAEFFDADNDGDLDLYVGSGGNENDPEELLNLDRLYLNDGKGNFAYSVYSLPKNSMNTSCIAPYDFDGDGDLDIFVGSRSYPKVYGLIPPQYFFENVGAGKFKDITKTICPELVKLGMVRAANWEDVDGDKKKELVVVGDWMAPKVFKVTAKKLVSVTTGLENYNGFWGALKMADLDNDGDLDMVLGNIGENFALKADLESPLKLWVSDFDNNQFVDKIFTKTHDGKDVTVFLKREMMEQFPFLKAKNLKHEEFAKKEISDFFDKGVLDKAQQTQVNYLKSAVAINDGKGHFKVVDLPAEVQFSCINAIQILDINNDSQKDIIMAGNFTKFIPQLTRLDACRGLVLLNSGKDNFKIIPNQKSGFTTHGEVKDLPIVTIAKQKYLISLENNQKPELFKIK